MRNNFLLGAILGLNSLFHVSAAPVEGVTTEALAVPPIVGGTAVGSATTYPFIVSLQITSHRCGATILSPTVIVTAAHCVVGESATSFKLRAGTLRHASGGTYPITLSSFTVHPLYSASTSDYDVAILKLSTALTFSSTISAATLVASGADPTAGTIVTVMGWGTTSSGSSSIPAALREVDVPIVSRSACQSDYPSESITSRMFCAGETNGGQDSCQGDSGGPIINTSTKVLLGAVSWGYGCADADYPGVYTNFADTTLAAWIRQQAGL